MIQMVNFTKDEMVELLLDYADALYDDNPPESIFEDNSAYVRDYVDGYFKSYFKE